MTRREPPGQIVVMFGLAMLAIALTVGLVVDGGLAFLSRRDGQNDADLGALAGTKVIADAWLGTTPARLSDVYAAIDRRLKLGGCAGGGSTTCTWTASVVGRGGAVLGPLTAGDGTFVAGSAVLGVRLEVTRRPRTYFLGLVGQASWRVDTTATALTARPASAPPSQLLPIALHEPDPNIPFRPGQVYDLTRDKIAPGGFAWVNWSRSSRGAVADSVCAPDNGAFRLGSTTVRRAPSDSDWSRVRGCLQSWVSSGATVLIPIYDAGSSAPNPPSYRIKAVAAFVIRSIDQPESEDLRATFVGTYAYPTVPADASQPPSEDDSLYYLGLVN